jgi:hypothetical protein
MNRILVTKAAAFVNELGGFGALESEEARAKVLTAEQQDALAVLGEGHHCRHRLGKFIETDSGNLSHAGAYYELRITGPEDELKKLAYELYGYEEGDLVWLT